MTALDQESNISPSVTKALSDEPNVSPALPNPSPPSTFWTHFPPWISTNLRSSRSWKITLRCSIACWGAFVILLPNQSLKTVGTTSFFGLLASLFLPPYLPVQLFFILMSTLMLGLLSGWGIGIAAMRAATASRSHVLLLAAKQQVKASIAANPALQANPTLAQTIAVFNGTFLDVRSTAVYGCFLAFAAFIFGLMRAYAPKLLFMSIFGTIAVDIFCTLGPLFPNTRYTLLNSTAISISCYMAIALLTTIFIFPETMNHTCLTAISDQLGRIKALMVLQDDVLTSAPADLAPGTSLITRIKSARASLIGAQKELMAFSGLINLEFSWGKWNGDDVKALEEPLLGIVVRIAGLQSFARLIGAPSPRLSEEQTNSTLDLSTNDTYLLRQIHKHNTLLEQNHSVRIEHMLPIINEATAELRRACAEGLEAAKASIDSVNQRRWRRNLEMDTKLTLELDEAITRLLSTLVAFKETNRLALLEPFTSMLNSPQTREEQDSLPLRSLYLSYVFGSNLIVTSNGLLSFMELVRDTVSKRKNQRLWAPKGLRTLGKLFTMRGGKTDGVFGDDAAPRPADLDQDDQQYRRDPDSKPPTNLFQKMMNGLYVLYHWTKSAEASFTFKYVFISIALWLPAVFKRSAHFFYVERGIWALIMAQTALNIYAADQVFNIVTRLIGTLIGLALGLAAWYIGNGSGKGNPYGVAASVGVLIVPIVFVRVYAPQKYLAATALGGATFALVVGYSWVDGHLPQYSSPGMGWSVAWRRWTLVAIGAGASFIIMMLPPTSGREAVRQRTASSITALSNVYGFLVSTWITNRADEKVAHMPAKWTRDFRTRLLSVAQEIHTIRELTDLAKWEGSIRGAWPSEEYTRLGDVQIEMISALAQLGGALGHLEDDWRLTFLHSTKVLNPHFIADVMSIFTLISQSLRTGEPMHQVLPHTLLDRLFYHHNRATVSAPGADDQDTIDIKDIKSLEYMFYATGVVAVYQLLQSLDELHRITRGLCGEVPMTGFASWRDEYERSHSLV